MTVELRRVAVFCGSNPGTDAAYADAATELGTLLAEREIGLVYGGGAVGLMGIVADAVLAGGGEAIGVIPQHLWDKEVGHRGLTELLVVGSMHERKLAMADRSDAFIGLPGGVGTFEAITWTQLGIQQKAVGFLDVAGFYGPLLRFLDDTVDQGFLRAEHRNGILAAATPSEMLARLEAWEPVTSQKWLNSTER